MAIKVVRRSDADVLKIRQCLAAYQGQHPRADILLYREDPYSVNMRIIDPDFAGMDRIERQYLVWSFFEQLDDRVGSQPMIVLPLTPEEASESLFSAEFDDIARAWARKKKQVSRNGKPTRSSRGK